ncbi:MAG: GAF domain-containing protein [Deltaproteobacteria bacterium]|nr:GAF domain-containing protein [Deltaproteobacteria bacterium]
MATNRADLVDDRLTPIEHLLGRDPRFADYAIAKRRAGYIEIVRGEQAIAICDESLRDADPARLHRALDRVSSGDAAVLVVGEPDDADLGALLQKGVYDFIPAGSTAGRLQIALRNAWEHLEVRARAESRGRWLRRYRYEIGELIEIARALTSERDLDRLLSIILEKSRFITGADAGSIYVVEGSDPDVLKRQLHFKLSQNDSLDFPSREFRMPISTRSVAGAAAVHRKFITVDDAYLLGEGSELKFDKSFDLKVGYRTKSMLAAPLISHSDDVIGVIQLINKKRDPDRKLLGPEDVEEQVIPFDDRSEELLATLAAQAGISLENAILYEEIRRIFEGFVRASVHAIEQRDPSTSGHSLRVSVLSVGLAEKVDRVDEGPYRTVRFSRGELRELEYAAMLHDFGKVGVREQVLVKAKKLYADQLMLIRARFDFIARSIDAHSAEAKMRVIERGGSAADLAAVEAETARRRGELDECWRLVREANEPTVLTEGDFRRIEEISKLTYVDLDGTLRPYLLPAETQCLGVQRGSLTQLEREEIQSHVVHTFNFLSRIPWGKSFKGVPLIAGAHHERLDGTGYPNQLTADAIPIQAKIMSIVDIYDALTASDRPYKKAVPPERALSILDFEVKDRHLDPELVRIFREAEVYRLVEGQLTY